MALAFGVWRRACCCCSCSGAKKPEEFLLGATGVARSSPYASSSDPVTVFYGLIERVFTGGDGQYPNYIEGKRAIEQRKDGYRSSGYFGPMPWRMVDSRTGAFIEEGV